jgi:hypothetical protein
MDQLHRHLAPKWCVIWVGGAAPQAELMRRCNASKSECVANAANGGVNGGVNRAVNDASRVDASARARAAEFQLGRAAALCEREL